MNDGVNLGVQVIVSWVVGIENKRFILEQKLEI